MSVQERPVSCGDVIYRRGNITGYIDGWLISRAIFGNNEEQYEKEHWRKEIRRQIVRNTRRTGRSFAQKHHPR
ncbi:hypothetical protein GJ744_006198 [Endocarpon pusillum]|uniref:Uncharacterized protein n=1 Tax=Endocarpon pusillum TaxID=364733 RepID=A0A8H7AP05_9EURO|nr:hypothetical protein GJ744_006198 [Endocarpon pusillum]